MSRAGRPRRDNLAIVNAAAELAESPDQNLGFLARVFAQAALPYKNPGNLPSWGRRNGGLTLTVQPGTTLNEHGESISLGYPYGTYPRLVLIWMATEAVRTGERVLPLGETLSDFMRQLGIRITGGKTGTIGRLEDQLIRLFNARINVHSQESTSVYERRSAEFLNISAGYDLWWSKKSPEQPTLIPSYVKLTEEFFNEVMSRPVPLDMDVLKQLRSSAVRLDIYAWLTYRMSYLRNPTHVSWDQLMFQFGSAGATRAARHKFRRDFTRHLNEVQVYYRDAHVFVDGQRGVTLFPSSPHVAKRSLGPSRRALPKGR